MLYMDLGVFAMCVDCLSVWSVSRFVVRRFRIKGLILPLFSLFFIFLLVFSSFISVFNGVSLGDEWSWLLWLLGVIGLVVLVVVVVLFRRKV